MADASGKFKFLSNEAFFLQTKKNTQGKHKRAALHQHKQVSGVVADPPAGHFVENEDTI